jgi:hypothetical protein
MAAATGVNTTGMLLPTPPGTAAGSKGGGGASDSAVGGLILFWSLRSPQYPERVILTPAGVTGEEKEGVYQMSKHATTTTHLVVLPLPSASIQVAL